MTYKTLPASRPAYSYDPVTRELLGTITVFLSPMDGTYPLPPATVDFAPGNEAGLFKRHRLTVSLDAWEMIADYRGVMLYDKATARPVPNTLTLGDSLPDKVTTSQPIAFTAIDYKRNEWDETASTWRAIPDYSAHALWEKATALPVEPLPVGEPLPIELTTMAPPPGRSQQVKWDSETQQWTNDTKSTDT